MSKKKILVDDEDYWPGDLVKVDGYPSYMGPFYIIMGRDGNWYQYHKYMANGASSINIC